MAKKCELEVKGLNLLLIKVKLQAEKKRIIGLLIQPQN